MNSMECAILQKLVSGLDDTRLLYTELGPLLIHPHLKYLVDRITLSHDAIAADLAQHMDTLGSQTPHRGGNALGKLRAHLETWLAFTSVDIDLSCLRQILRNETRLVQCFHADLDDVEGLPNSLHRGLCHLEYVMFQIELRIQEMETPTLAFAHSATTVARADPAHIGHVKANLSDLLRRATKTQFARRLRPARRTLQ